MEVKITKRDKWMLHGLVVFVFLAAMSFQVILPLRTEYLELRSRYQIQKEQIELSGKRAGELTELQHEYKRYRQALKEAQSEYYPLMDKHEIDGMLTEFVTEQGIGIQRFSMEEHDFKQKSHICAMVVTMELTGEKECLCGLLEMWEEQLYGSRILSFSWEEEEMEGRLHLQAAVFMSGDSQKIWKGKSTQDGENDFRD